ncbi:MAG: hypothetical protein WAV98_01835 [Minisyncoccia bacterium]
METEKNVTADVLKYESEVAENLLRIISPLLSGGTMWLKGAQAKFALNVILKIPMGEFLNLRNTVQDFQRMDDVNQENVLTQVRTKILAAAN